MKDILTNLEPKDMREDVLHLDPVTDAHACVGPDPVHQRAQLKQERHTHEPVNTHSHHSPHQWPPTPTDTICIFSHHTEIYYYMYMKNFRY